MSEQLGNKKADAHSERKRNDDSHANSGWGFKSLLTVFVELLLAGELSDQYWHAWWFECLLAAFVVTLAYTVYVNFRRLTKCGRPIALYLAFIVSSAVAVAILSSYVGSGMPNSYRGILVYSGAAIVSAILIAPIWYVAHRLVTPLAVIDSPTNPSTHPVPPAPPTEFAITSQATVANNLLIPSNEPDPPFLSPTLASIPDGLKAMIMSRFNHPSILKVYLGPELGATTRASQSVIAIDEDELMSISRSPDGIAVDARIIGDDGKIVLQIAKNRFYSNSNNMFRMERPDSHTLIVFDMRGDEVLNIRYSNPGTIRVLGRFRSPSIPKHVLSVDAKTVRFVGHVGQGNLSLDNVVLFQFLTPEYQAMHPMVAPTPSAAPTSAPASQPSTSSDAQATTTQSASAHVAVRIAKSLLNDGSDRNHGVWRIGFHPYPTFEGKSEPPRIPETMRPVPAAFFLQFVNQTGASLMVDSFQIEFQTPSGDWKETTVVRPATDPLNPVVMIGGLNPAPINAIGLNGAYNFESQIDHKNIAPGETVQGWLFMDATERLGATTKFRFQMSDTTGRSFTEQIGTAQPMKDKAFIDSLIFGGFSDDISHVRVQAPWH